MRMRIALMRRFVAIAVAAVFVFAVQPGAMAMPAPQHPAAAMKMDCAGHAKTPCDHAKGQQDRSAPCKDMGACLGMMSCFGMAASFADAAPMRLLSVRDTAPHIHQTGLGIVLQPDNPPPIA